LSRHLFLDNFSLGEILKHVSLLLFSIILSSVSFASVECDFTKEPTQLEKVIKSKNFITLEKRTYKSDNAKYVTGLRVDQILKMTRQTLNEKVDSVLEAVNLFDDNRIMRYDFTSQVNLPADYYTVIFSYIGDTEVGAIFEGGSSYIVAEMSDGDLKICNKKNLMP
jgi:hypothetical protein